MKALRQTIAAALVLALSGTSGWGNAGLAAQDVQGQPDGPSIQAETVFAGVPSYSVMKAESGMLSLSTTAMNAFAPFAIPCPSTAGPNGCTMRVTLSSQFWSIEATTAVLVALTITGPGTLVPNAPVNVASNSAGSWASAYTMQWLKRNIPAGSTVTLNVQFDMVNSTGFAGYRIMSVDVFSGLI